MVHDKLLSEIAQRLGDARVIQLIRRYLRAGVVEQGVVRPSTMGTPQGGPLSPLLSNLLQDVVTRPALRSDQWEPTADRRGLSDRLTSPRSFSQPRVAGC